MKSWSSTGVANFTDIGRQFTPPPDSLVSLTGRLTAFVSNITMALVQDVEVVGSRQLVMGNSAQQMAGLTGRRAVGVRNER